MFPCEKHSPLTIFNRMHKCRTHLFFRSVSLVSRYSRYIRVRSGKVQKIPISIDTRILLLWLQVGILVSDILDTGTILLGIQVMMTYNHRFGVTAVEFLKQSSHGSLLSFSACVVGLTADVEPALVADADRVGIMVYAVGPDHPFRTTWLNRSVTTDHVVVADTKFPMVIAAVPRVDLSGRRGLVRSYCRTVNDNHGDGSHAGEY